MLLPLIMNNLGMGTFDPPVPFLSLSMGGATIAVTVLDSSLALVSEGEGIAAVAIPSGLLTLSLSARGANANITASTWETIGVITYRYEDLTDPDTVDTANSPEGTSWGAIQTAGFFTVGNEYKLWYRLALSDFHPDWDDALWREPGITWTQPDGGGDPYEEDWEAE